MIHIIILYLIILLLIIYPLNQLINKRKQHCSLNKIPIKRELLKKHLPELLDFCDKEAIIKLNPKGIKSTPVIRYELEKIPIIYIPFNTIPFSLREFSFLILINDSLGMKGGKIISQISHGLFNLFGNDERFGKTNPLLSYWVKTGQAKIILKCNELEIMKRIGMAKANEVPFEIVNDAGRTQVAPGSLTVAFIGPWFVFVNKKISEGLKLM